ncbi:hypothetical protein [Microbacterium sp. A93]|uniref:hypothetical protein n=1 Tax=Microbacterium sp. A93 TaxID=3450716 RepID=UPI003F445105
MRWDGLFADLEAQLAHGRWQDTEMEAAELTRGERASIVLADRLRGALGRPLTVLLEDGQRLELTVSTVGATWLGGTDQNGSLVISLDAVAAIDSPLAVTVPDSSPGRRNLTIGSLFRSLSRARAGVLVSGRDGRVLGEGTIDRVGLDHLDLAVHPRDEQRRGRNVRGLRVIPFGAIHVMRSAQASSV